MVKQNCFGPPLYLSPVTASVPFFSEWWRVGFSVNDNSNLNIPNQRLYTDLGKNRIDSFLDALWKENYNNMGF